MIYITQLIYLVAGQENVLDEFECIAIPIISKYNGRLLLRIRPTENNFVEANMDKPYEVHIVEFDEQQDFDAFKQDDERKQFLHLRDQSIKASILIQGVKL